MKHMNAWRCCSLIVVFGLATSALNSGAQTAATGPATATEASAATQPTDPIEVNLKDMSLFDFDQNNGTLNDIPRRFRELDGKRVTFACEMWDPKTKADATLASFWAVYSLNDWSFRGARHAQDFWQCTPADGVQIRLLKTAAIVTGTLHVRILKANGFIQSIYQVDVGDARPYTADFPPPAHGTTRPDF
jgi:hypothetical protein